MREISLSPRILDAAIRFNDRIFTGRRYDEIMNGAIKEVEEMRGLDGEQGFLANNGSFIDFPTAVILAYSSGQIPTTHGISSAQGLCERLWET